MPFLINIVQGLMMAVWLAVLGRVIMSWVDPQSVRPVSQLLYRATEPILAPVRNILPRSGQLDMSPFVFLVGLGFAMRVTLTL